MNNEEKILQTLEKHGEMLEKHGEMLERQGEMLEEMSALLQKVAVTQEAVVLPQLKLLAEGHQNLLDTLAPKPRVEALEEEVDTLKTVVRLLTHDVAELKKAQ